MVKVSGFGPADAKIVVVGEHPDRSEEIEGKPFAGRSGDLLKRYMLRAGINPDKVYLTNVSKYRPPGDFAEEFSSDGAPNARIIEGLIELEQEISRIRPNLVLALGNYALWSMAPECARWSKKRIEGKREGYTGIGDWRGSLIRSSGLAEGYKVLAAYHPAAVSRKRSFGVFLDLDLKRAAEQAAFPDLRLPHPDIEINPDQTRREIWREILLSSPMITFDIEYLGSDLLCVGMTNSKERALVIQICNSSDLDYVRSILCSGVPLCAQNAAFDCSILEHWYSMPVLQYIRHDTMLAAHAAYIELPKDLGTLCSIYTEQPCYWTKVDWKKVRAGLQPIEEVLTYNGHDVWVTHAVMEAQIADELQVPATRKVFEHEMSLLAPLWEMSKTGVRFSQERVKEMQEELEVEIALKGSELEALCGRKLNVMSPKDMPWLMFDFLGMKPGRVTKTGKPSCDDMELAKLTLKADTPHQKTVVQLVRDIRKARNLISKFCDIELDTDGRLRSHYNPAGTTTGRLASKKFYPTGKGAQGQNHPRDKRARKCFVPDNGCVFFYNDLERAESLVVAHITGDPLMLKHHAPGVNAHKELGSLLFGMPVSDIDKEGDIYYLAKRTRHAGNYMLGWKRFMDYVNKDAAVTGVAIDAAYAKKLITGYRDLHVGLTRWWGNTKLQLVRTGTLHNLFGRPRQFFEYLDSILPEAVAYVPQSTVGDLLNYGYLRCYHDPILRSLGVQYLMQVHDAIGGQVPVANMAPAMARMRQLMRIPLLNPRGEEFIVPIEINIGPSWGEVKPWEEDLKQAA